MRAPLLERLDITLFNQIAFALPHLSHLINVTQRFKLPAARVSFLCDEVSILMTPHGSRYSDGPCRLSVMCKKLDWQIDCAAQICSESIPTPSGVERFTLHCHDKIQPTEWHNDEIDYTTWHELLRSFIGVRALSIHGAFLEELARVMQVDEGGSEPWFLPGLQYIIAASDPFASFIDIRRVVGRPVWFWPTWRTPPVLRPLPKASPPTVHG